MRVYIVQLAGITLVSIAAGYAIYWRTGTPMAGWFVGIAFAYLAMRVLQHRYRKAPLGGKTKSGGESAHAEQAVILEFALADGGAGSDHERARIQALAEACDLVVRRERVGEYDGDEFGQGLGRLFFYGPDAEAIADLVNRCAHQVAGLPPAVMLVREGGPGAPERRFPIASAP